MGCSIFRATIKKIEIINKTLKDEWQQSIRVVLGDIELNNENLIELRRFRPDETINVSFETIQLCLDDFQRDDHPGLRGDSPTVEDGTSIHEGELPLEAGAVVEKEFTF